MATSAHEDNIVFFRDLRPMVRQLRALYDGTRDDYDEMATAGAALGLASDADPVTSSFLRRVSGSAEGARDGVATIKAIYGDTVGWNQLAHHFSTFSAGAYSSYVSYTSDGANHAMMWECIASGTPISDADAWCGGVTILPNEDWLIVAGHKFIFSVEVMSSVARVTFRSATRGRKSSDNKGLIVYDIANVTTDAAGKWQKASWYYTATEDRNSLAMFRRGTTDTIAAGETWGYRNPQIFDLTAMFGAGNEPATVEEFEALYPLPYYPYNAGTLKPVNMTGVETVGFNQWDEEWEVGSIDTTTGEDTVYNNAIRSKGYIDAFPNTVYDMSFAGTAVTSNVFFYDAGKNFLGYFTVGTTKYFTTPDKCRYMRFYLSASYGTTYKGDIAIHLRWSGYRDGEHESYWKSQRAIDVAQYFPTGLKRVGDKRDALYKDHADVVVGAVDLGTATWILSASTDHERFHTSIVKSLIKAPSANSSLANIRCSKFATDSASNTYSRSADNIIGVDTSGEVYIYASAYMDMTVEQFKAALSGVILYYEKATPTVTPIDPPLNLSYRVDTFGTEAVVVEDGVISAPPVLDIAYGYDAESLRDSALSVVAPVENHRAGANYAVGSYLVSDGVLYRVTQAIASGEQITPGTNVTATTVMAEVAALNS